MRWGTPVRRMAGIAADALPYGAILAAQTPVVIEGVAADWPIVQQGLRGAEPAANTLKRFGADAPVTLFTAPPETGGRFHYDAAVTGLNFTASRARLGAVLDQLLAVQGQADAPALYVGSTDLDLFLPGFRTENHLALDHPDFGHGKVLASIWIGNRTTAAAHHDISNNIACCLVGRRRFTLFPPDQVVNLYPGPLEPTPGGQVVTMVDFRAPDLARYPRFAEAMEVAQVAELEPGDMLYYPAMWWHQVDALADFNVMANYWWNPVPAHIDTPQNTLLHALLALRDRPDSEKAAWRAMFDYYVFGDAGQAGAHLPEAARGALGPMDAMTARRLRAQLLNRFNR